MKNYHAPGDKITYTNTGTAIASGDVVIVGCLVGVAAVDIAATTGVGTVEVEGVFRLPKVTTDVVTVGAPLWWDASVGKFAATAGTPATGDVAGSAVAWEAAGNGTTEVLVKLNAGGGTVT